MTSGKDKPKNRASSTALVTFNGKILLLLRDNVPVIANPNKWGLIGGVVEKGESYDEALLREVEEEICLKPKNFRFGGLLPLEDGIFHALYLVKLKKEEVKKTKLGNEGQKLGWFTPEEVIKINSAPEVERFFRQYLIQIQKVVSGEKVSSKEFKLV